MSNRFGIYSHHYYHYYCYYYYYYYYYHHQVLCCFAFHGGRLWRDLEVWQISGDLKNKRNVGSHEIDENNVNTFIYIYIYVHLLFIYFFVYLCI